MRRGSSVCVVPDHREIKTGTLSGVLKLAGVSCDEFPSALANVWQRPSAQVRAAPVQSILRAD